MKIPFVDVEAHVTPVTSVRPAEEGEPEAQKMTEATEIAAASHLGVHHPLHLFVLEACVASLYFAVHYYVETG